MAPRSVPISWLSSSLRRMSARFAQIVPVEIEAIEGVIGEPVEASVAEVRLQKRKLGDAALVLDHQLAVDQGGAHGQIAQRCRNGVAEFIRPIEAAPSPERNLAVLDMRLKPIAVELDLMQPSVAGGRRLRQCRQHRLDKAGQGTLGRALDRGRVRRLSRRRAPASIWFSRVARRQASRSFPSSTTSPALPLRARRSSGRC